MNLRIKLKNSKQKRAQKVRGRTFAKYFIAGMTKHLGFFLPQQRAHPPAARTRSRAYPGVSTARKGVLGQ